MTALEVVVRGPTLDLSPDDIAIGAAVDAKFVAE